MGPVLMAVFTAMILDCLGSKPLKNGAFEASFS
jgi:hypothetical protein